MTHFFYYLGIATAFCLIQANEKPLTSQERVIVNATSQDDPKTPAFKGMSTDFLRKPLNKETFKQEIVALNPNHEIDDLFTKKNWNIDFYNKKNLPVVLGTLEDQKKFSSELEGHGLRFLDLPIYMPNQGWRIPPQLEQFQEVIAKAVAFEQVINPNFEKTCYVYITVDQGIVEPHVSQRRAGWHGDSYRKINTKTSSLTIPVDHVYVIADCCPTLFVPGPFSLDAVDPENVDQVLEAFASVANSQSPITYPNYTLLKMDPYCVHDAGINQTDKTLHRTFVKISFSESKYCKLGNAHNQLFIYDWPMVPRHKVPYGPEAMKQSAHRKDRDHFQEVNIAQIDFLKKTCHLPWVKSEIHDIVRTRPVHAERAKEQDILQTNMDGFLVTIWVARKDQWKVTSEDGYQVFMDDVIFKNIYKLDPERPTYFQPKCEIRRTIELAEDIRFYTPLGVLEYGRKGDMVIYLNSDDIYVVPRKVFEAKYRIL